MSGYVRELDRDEEERASAVQSKWHVQRLIMGGCVARYHTRPITPQTVGQHSFGVAMILQRLWPDCSKELILAGLQHDLGEQETGDTPAPMKWRDPELHRALNDAEARASAEMGFAPIKLSPLEQKALKLADILELTAWAKLRTLCGEVSYQRVFHNGEQYAQNLINGMMGVDAGQTRLALAALYLLAEIREWRELFPDSMGEPIGSVPISKATPVYKPGPLTASLEDAGILPAAPKYLEPNMANVGRKGEMPPVSHAMPYEFTERCLCFGVGCNRCEPQGRG